MEPDEYEVNYNGVQFTQRANLQILPHVSLKILKGGMLWLGKK